MSGSCEGCVVLEHHYHRFIGGSFHWQGAGYPRTGSRPVGLPSVFATSRNTVQGLLNARLTTKACAIQASRFGYDVANSWVSSGALVCICFGPLLGLIGLISGRPVMFSLMHTVGFQGIMGASVLCRCSYFSEVYFWAARWCTDAGG